MKCIDSLLGFIASLGKVLIQRQIRARIDRTANSESPKCSRKIDTSNNEQMQRTSLGEPAPRQFRACENIEMTEQKTLTQTLAETYNALMKIPAFASPRPRLI
jgi:hypothetical protein